MKVFDSVYAGKKVLITGHTGFKGSWLTAWLLKLGAIVIGYSKDIPTDPSIFLKMGLDKKINHCIGNVCDLDELTSVIARERPDFIFHLAAQAIVSKSYMNPTDTFSTNVIGTLNILEALRLVSYRCVLLLVTSDKCYDNVEWPWGYKETDILGGKDPYSGSKGAAELVAKSYFHSFFNEKSEVRIGIGRAGNVIGGGDWAKDRIVADAVRAWSMGEKVEIRSPNSTRPWQHVLEPLSGYLLLAARLAQGEGLNGEAFNFGPQPRGGGTVLELLMDLSGVWGFKDADEAYKIVEDIPFHESSLLRLNCDKALLYLKWQPTLEYLQMIDLVGGWYRDFYRFDIDSFELTSNQICDYEKLAFERRVIWIN